MSNLSIDSFPPDESSSKLRFDLLLQAIKLFKCQENREPTLFANFYPRETIYVTLIWLFKVSCYSNLEGHSYLKVLRDLQTLNVNGVAEAIKFENPKIRNALRECFEVITCIASRIITKFIKS